MKLGAYVIHGNSVSTLGAALDSLLAVADQVVAVDSESTDGSSRLVTSRGVQQIIHPWRGFGSARKVAAEALAGCDWVFFLDSDEWLTEPNRAAVRAFKATSPEHDVYRLGRHDWAELPSAPRFRFRTQWHIRLVRHEAAKWSDQMIVHESLERPAGRYPAFIEHHFASSLEGREAKDHQYALLWALRAALEGKPAKTPWPQQFAHLFRNAVVKGAAWRGGLAGWRLSWNAANYHRRKYEYLREVRAGLHAEALEALRAGDIAEVLRRVSMALTAPVG